jgi:hypothetical protein
MSPTNPTHPPNQYVIVGTPGNDGAELARLMAKHGIEFSVVRLEGVRWIESPVLQPDPTEHRKAKKRQQQQALARLRKRAGGY